MPLTVVVQSGGHRATPPDLRNLSTLIVSIMAGLPDATARVEHICWSEETDGVIVAVRWVLTGKTRPGGFLGEAFPAGQPVAMMVCSHLRFYGRQDRRGVDGFRRDRGPRSGVPLRSEASGAVAP